ncbi:conserved hypothetical protein [Mycobacterium ulcerans Agy99]|uniref:Uncharacterized protein n=1 Tax=Mycobacterium ulcerans (strain Agy99) TaxID=362242 RepID=A0PWF6_MYCUA|nr:conserved hypothetical protein [Mycobacterium ulcerans Agy99]OIN22398.1 hypothetical protein A3649_22065 [Mycobacterium ulcerans]
MLHEIATIRLRLKSRLASTAHRGGIRPSKTGSSVVQANVNFYRRAGNIPIRAHLLDEGLVRRGTGRWPGRVL